MHKEKQEPRKHQQESIKSQINHKILQYKVDEINSLKLN